MSNPNDFHKLVDEDGILVGYGNEQARALWDARSHLVDERDVDDLELIDPDVQPEQFYAIRSTDDTLLLGEYEWMRTDGPNDWTIAEECDEGDFEIVLMTVTPIARKTWPLPRCAECGSDEEHDGVKLIPHPIEGDGWLICDGCAELGGEAGGA